MKKHLVIASAYTVACLLLTAIIYFIDDSHIMRASIGEFIIFLVACGIVHFSACSGKCSTKRVLLELSLYAVVGAFSFLSLYYYLAPLRSDYAVIITWMGLLWISALFRMQPRTALYCFVFIVIVITILISCPLDIFEGPNYWTFNFSYIFLSIIFGIPFVLPILINNAIFFIEKKLKAKFCHKC